MGVDTRPVCKQMCHLEREREREEIERDTPQLVHRS